MLLLVTDAVTAVRFGIVQQGCSNAIGVRWRLAISPVADECARSMTGGDGVRSGRRGTRLLQIVLSVAAVVLMARLVDLRQAAHVLAGARLTYVLAAVALYLVGQVMSAYRWRLIGTSVGLADDFAHYVRYYFIGMFFMFFGPSTLGGDLVRSLYLAEGSRRRARAFNSVLFDRANGLVVLIAIGAAAFVLFPRYGLPLPLLYATVALGTGLLLAWWLAPWVTRLVLPADHRLRRFVEGDLGPFWGDRTMLFAASGVSLVFHAVQILTQLLVSRALALDVPLTYICIFHPLVSALAAIPITLSGIGLREGGYLFFLTHIGIDRERALAYGVLWLLVIVVNSLIGGLVFAWNGGRLPALRAARD
jgi:glycosyltransferase 2 family protein